MRNLPPADELAQIRDAMRRLKIREAVLRRIVLDDPTLRDGIDARAVVRDQKRRSLNVALLPDSIRNTARYWTTTETQIVLIENRSSAAAQPAQAVPGRPLAALARGVPGDFAVIEPF